MSQENVERLRWGFEQTQATGQFVWEFAGPDFVWDMSKFRGWPEEQYYKGIEGGRRAIAEWLATWDDWEMELESLHDAGQQVVAVVRQRGRSKASGVRVEMLLAQVWSFEGGLTTRMVTYADPAEALKAVGLV